MKKIPKEIVMFSQTIKIRMRKNLRETKNAVGFCDYEKMTIYLQSSTREDPLSKDFIEQAFCHEIEHMRMYMAGDVKVAHATIDVLGSLLKQILDQLIK